MAFCLLLVFLVLTGKHIEGVVANGRASSILAFGTIVKTGTYELFVSACFLFYSPFATILLPLAPKIVFSSLQAAL
jgi:hypothetical protein